MNLGFVYYGGIMVKRNLFSSSIPRINFEEFGIASRRKRLTGEEKDVREVQNHPIRYLNDGSPSRSHEEFIRPHLRAVFQGVESDANPIEEIVFGLLIFQ